MLILKDNSSSECGSTKYLTLSSTKTIKYGFLR